MWCPVHYSVTEQTQSASAFPVATIPAKRTGQQPAKAEPGCCVSFTILIVDDNAFIRHSLRCCLEREPEWKVCGEAENGQIAVEKVKELSPDVVILDWQMPVMNGLEAARHIARIAPKTAMVMLTLHIGTIVVQEAQAAGIQHVLSKTDPVPGRLISSLRKVCGMESAEGRPSLESNLG